MLADVCVATLSAACLPLHQHALIENERKITLAAACNIFKSSNPKWPEIQCLVIYKDFTEMAALAEAFPQARMLLCQQHVKKYLHRESAKPKYRFFSFERDLVRSACDELIHAPSEQSYERSLWSLRHVIQDQETLDAWMQYFGANWTSSN